MKNIILISAALLISNICFSIDTNNDQIIINTAKKVYQKWSAHYKKKTVIIVDFSKPMEQDRLFIVDISTSKIILRTKVCHGIGSGESSVPYVFSNKPESKMSYLLYPK